jgi:hypothetical protein
MRLAATETIAGGGWRAHRDAPLQGQGPAIRLGDGRSPDPSGLQDLTGLWGLEMGLGAENTRSRPRGGAAPPRLTTRTWQSFRPPNSEPRRTAPGLIEGRVLLVQSRLGSKQAGCLPFNQFGKERLVYLAILIVQRGISHQRTATTACRAPGAGAAFSAVVDRFEQLPAPGSNLRQGIAGSALDPMRCDSNKKQSSSRAFVASKRLGSLPSAKNRAACPRASSGLPHWGLGSHVVFEHEQLPIGSQQPSPGPQR